MSPTAIVSYDDTQNDHDALALGRTLRAAGATLTLAYIRHAVQKRLEHEQLSQHEAEALLARGARWLADEHTDRRIVMSPSTSAGLRWLAETEHADIVVFGSDYRTRRGHVAVGRSAQTLLEGGSTAVALAPSDFAATGTHEIATIGILSGSADEAAIETAFSIAERLGARVVDTDRRVDLLLVGSRAEAREGHVMLTSSARNAIDEATCPVLVVARGVPLHFDTLITA